MTSQLCTHTKRKKAWKILSLRTGSQEGQEERGEEGK